MATKDEAIATLENAIAGDKQVESSPTDTVGKSTTDVKTTKEIGGIPKVRFDEVNERMKTAEAEVTQLRNKLQESITSTNKMTEMLEVRQRDSDVLARIRELADDPKYSDAVMALDRKLKGIEDEVDEGDKSPEQGAKETKALIEKTRNELTDMVADQRADLILARADNLAERFLSNLPAEYTEQDKTVLARIWVDEVNWDLIDKNPSALESEISESFQRSVDVYGTPRGAYIDPNSVEFVDETQTAEPDPVEELRALVGKNWGEVKSSDTKKGIFEPTFSDEEFAAAAGEAMRRSNKG